MQLSLTYRELDQLHLSLNMAIDRYAALLRGEGDSEAAQLVTADIAELNALKVRVMAAKVSAGGSCPATGRTGAWCTDQTHTTCGVR